MPYFELIEFVLKIILEKIFIVSFVLVYLSFCLKPTALFDRMNVPV